MTEFTLKIHGMKCTTCVKSLTEKLSALEGVEKVDVSLAGGTIDVSFDDTRITINAIEDAVSQIGFEVNK